MNKQINKILLKNNIFPIVFKEKIIDEKKIFNVAYIGTILSNLSYYGYAPNKDLLNHLKCLNDQELVEAYKEIEESLKEIKKIDKDLKSAMVYKNFPEQVLSIDEAQYVNNQILIYLGENPDVIIDNKTIEREKNLDTKNLKVLSIEKTDSLIKIFNDYLNKKTKFTEEEKEDVLFLFSKKKNPSINISEIGFKENAILLGGYILQNGLGEVYVKDATDVLRICHLLSGGAGDLKEKVKFISFTKKQRRQILTMLENSQNLKSDLSAKSGEFKKLLHNLHPGDYKKQFPKVIEANNLLYNDKLLNFNSLVDLGIKNKDKNVFNLIKSRPGEFLRKWHYLYNIFNKDAVNELIDVIKNDKLDNLQLLKFQKYINTISDRQNLLIAPKGKWSMLKVIENKKTINNEDIELLNNAINTILNTRLSIKFPNGIALDERLENIKLPSNDQEISYGRGSVFSMDKKTTFVRSASYWETKDIESTVWFDNGWNFFDDNWCALGTICWNSPYDGSLFSGDPVNSLNADNAGCQVIDLDLEKLKNNGVKYAVWNILGYSSIPFEKANVRGLLQFGENALTGEVFEPSRINLAFDLKGNGLTKYISIVDVVNKKIIYIDANLKGQVSSAKTNEKYLSETMPDFMQYLKTLPSVYDLLKNAPTGDLCVLYNDDGIDLKENEKAFVFEKKNKLNNIDNISLNDLLSNEVIENKKIENEKKDTKKLI